MAKRTNNFTNMEVQLLLELVATHSHILENKKTDRVSVDEKSKVWNKISAEFNTKFTNCFRSDKTLRTKYENIKRNSKKNFARDRCETYRTGGGSKTASAVTSIDNLVLEICQAEQLEGCPAEFDDDVIEKDIITLDINNNNQNRDDQISTEHSESFVNNNDPDQVENGGISGEPLTLHSWSRHLKKPLSQELQQKKRGTKDVWCDVAYKKLEKIQIEKKLLTEQHDLKKKEHEKFMQKIDLDIEKSQLEIELLKLQINKIK